ncbi:MAG: hypothetical protein ABIA04_01995 [Pseudomonadota bacterium]
MKLTLLIRTLYINLLVCFLLTSLFYSTQIFANMFSPNTIKIESSESCTAQYFGPKENYYYGDCKFKNDEFDKHFKIEIELKADNRLEVIFKPKENSRETRTETIKAYPIPNENSFIEYWYENTENHIACLIKIANKTNEDGTFIAVKVTKHMKEVSYEKLRYTQGDEIDISQYPANTLFLVTKLEGFGVLKTINIQVLDETIEHLVIIDMFESNLFLMNFKPVIKAYDKLFDVEEDILRAYFFEFGAGIFMGKNKSLKVFSYYYGSDTYMYLVNYGKDAYQARTRYSNVLVSRLSENATKLRISTSGKQNHCLFETIDIWFGNGADYQVGDLIRVTDYNGEVLEGTIIIDDETIKDAEKILYKTKGNSSLYEIPAKASGFADNYYGPPIDQEYYNLCEHGLKQKVFLVKTENGEYFRIDIHDSDVFIEKITHDDSLVSVNKNEMLDELYPNGIGNLGDMPKQGQTGDCYLVAGLIALRHNEGLAKSTVKETFQKIGDKTWYVSFLGRPEIGMIIDESELGVQFAQDPQSAQISPFSPLTGPLGDILIEFAYGRLRRAAYGKKTRYDLWEQKELVAVGGGSANRFLKDIIDPNKFVTSHKFSLLNNRSRERVTDLLINKANNPENFLLTVSTNDNVEAYNYSKTFTRYGNHSLTLTEVLTDSQNRPYIIKNPHNPNIKYRFSFSELPSAFTDILFVEVNLNDDYFDF